MIIPISDDIYRLAAENGISKNTLRKRIRSSGWEPELAATRPIMTHAEAVAMSNRDRKGYFTDEQKAIIKANGLNTNLVYGRIRANWSLEDAMTTQPISLSEAGRRGMQSRYYGTGPKPYAGMKIKKTTAKTKVQEEPRPRLSANEVRKRRTQLLYAMDNAQTTKEYDMLRKELVNIR